MSFRERPFFEPGKISVTAASYMLSSAWRPRTGWKPCRTPSRSPRKIGACVLNHSCVDNSNTFTHIRGMKEQSTTAEVNIHLRASPKDRKRIDRAAKLAGVNRSQFMLASALKEAKNILLDQSAIHADAKAFQKIMD